LALVPLIFTLYLSNITKTENYYSSSANLFFDSSHMAISPEISGRDIFTSNYFAFYV
jgi:hypothetical protein